MNKSQVANWNRHLKVRKVRTDNAGAAIPPLAQRVWAQHEHLMAAAEELMAAPTGRTQGATLKKSEEEKRAIAAALPLANALYLLYLEDQDDASASEKAHALRRNKSDYTNLAGPLTLAETRNVARQAQALKKELEKEAGLDAADLKALADANDAFATQLTAPQSARATGKTTRTNLDAALKVADKFIESTLRPSTKTLKGKLPALYDALTQAMRIDDAPGPRKGDNDLPGPDTPPKA